MYRKVLLIGLGGSGGKTLRFLKRDLVEWLESKGWKDGIPTGWQFLHIDSPTTADGLEAGGAPLESSEYVGLVSKGTTLDPLVQKLDGVPGSLAEMTGWRVEPSTAPDVALEIGCGQYRALGRTVGLSFAQAIRQGIQGAVDRMSQVDVEPELKHLYQNVHGTSAGEAAGPPIPIIISSLAGGTGAGLILDVADVLHSMNESWANLSMGLYYTSDVFPDAAGKGVHPNGVAAVSEVLNGAWWGASGSPSDKRLPAIIPGKQSPVLSMIAGLDKGVRRTGTHCNFLIGGTNAKGAAIGRDGRLFEMVGGALLSWVTDPVVQENFVAYTAANWAQRASDNRELNVDVVVNKGALGEPGLPAFSALGFSRVSVGTKYLRRYAAQRLANDAATHMAEAHILSDRAKAIITSEGLASPVRVVERLVEDIYPRFRQHIDVSELNGGVARTDFSISQNIEEALTPNDFREFVSDRQRWIASQVREEKDATGEVWVDRLLPAVREAQQEMERRIAMELPGAADAWAQRAAESIPEVVEAAVAEHGLRVTIGLVEGLAGELNSRVSGALAELDKMTQDYLAWSGRSSVEEATRAAMADVLTKGKVAADSDYVEQAIIEAVKFARCSSLALVTERAALLLERFANDFLRPMAQALREGLTELVNASAERADWPDYSSGLPPKELEPPRSEYTVIEKEDFAATFEALLRETFGGKSDLQARAEARSDISGGLSIRRSLKPLRPMTPEWNSLSDATMLVVAQPWLPGYEVSGGSVASRKAVFSTRCRPSQILQRADKWLMRPDFPFENLLSLDLRSYTQSPDNTRDDAPEYIDRQNRVVAKLEAAIGAAAPLVRLNEQLLSSVHTKMTDGGLYEISVSMIPFRGHPLEARISSLMLGSTYKGRQNAFEAVFTNDSDLPYIDVISSLSAPVSPIVIESLMGPIGQEWARAQTSLGGRTAFWELRRTRPLREFIPVPQRHLRCMIRGWFTGRMLGLIETSSMPYQIVHDVQGVNARSVAFPTHFLTASTPTRMDELPFVLESMPLAMLEVNRSSSLGALEPYAALRDLGMTSPSGSEILKYETLNPVLSHWIETGEVLDADRLRTPGKVHPDLQDHADPEGRRKALQALIKKVMQEYETAFGEYSDNVQRSRMKLSIPPLWPGLHDEIQVALSAILMASAAESRESAGL